MTAMKRVLQHLTLKQLRDFIGSSNTTRRFANRHDLVYFGSVGRDDESRLIKGVTISNTYRDSHYLVGTDFGRDVIFVQRTDSLYAANQKRRETYTWNILTIDLAEHHRLPHIYLEGKSRHGHAFHEAIAMKNREFSELPTHFLQGYDPKFNEKFSVRLSAAASLEFPLYINPERAAVLAYHFPMLDFEWHDDVLYVYFLSSHPTLTELEHMFKAGVWLAGELDNSPQSAEVSE